MNNYYFLILCAMVISGTIYLGGLLGLSVSTSHNCFQAGASDYKVTATYGTYCIADRMRFSVPLSAVASE